jgi:hypothetical protein
MIRNESRIFHFPNNDSMPSVGPIHCMSTSCHGQIKNMTDVFLVVDWVYDLSTVLYVPYVETACLWCVISSGPFPETQACTVVIL